MNLAALRHRIILKRGSDLLRKEQWQKASSLLDRAAKLSPTSWESHNNLAIALLKLGRFEEAAGVAQRAIRLAPHSADSHDLFGIALLQMERWEEAVAAYRRAIAVDPARYDLHDRLGLALLRLARWSEVVDAYEAALTIDAERGTAHHRRGIALLYLHRWDAAAEAFRRAIELSERDPAASGELAGIVANLASAVTHIEPSEQRLATLRRNVSTRPDKASLVTLGVELLKLGRWEEAVSELATASALAPRMGCIHFLRVDPLIRLGRFPEAVGAHQQAVAAGGDTPSYPGQPSDAQLDGRREEFWTSGNLGTDVFAAERWLEQLSIVPPKSETGQGSKLVFVLDHDFGELTTLKYLLLGQPQLAGRATLLLPERLYAHNTDAVPGRTRRYASVKDILAAVDREHADIVFLCSGYLLWDHLAFSAEELRSLVAQLRDRGCRVVTADPFLGMLSQQDARTLISIDVPATHPVWTVEQLRENKRPIEQRMQASFAESEQVLRDAYHLYPGFCDAGDSAAPTDARNVAFFNDRLVRATTPTRPVAETLQPHWLFVLNSADCGVQMLFEGETGFADIVARKLVEARAAGRHPILIAPADFIEKLTPRMPTADGIDVLAHCPFTRFMSLLVSAEHAFYWNVVSHSLLIRLYNRLPVVVFDRGHLVRNAPPIRDRVVRWYYQGWEPPIRDHREPLTLDAVEAWTADYRRQADRLVERFRRAPLPDQLIADLMRSPMSVSAVPDTATGIERSMHV